MKKIEQIKYLLNFYLTKRIFSKHENNNLSYDDLQAEVVNIIIWGLQYYFLTNDIDMYHYSVWLFNLALYAGDEIVLANKDRINLMCGYLYPKQKNNSIFDEYYFENKKRELKIKNSSYFFTDEQMEIKKHKCKVISAKTSFGKSFLIKQEILLNKKDNYLILVPTLALINEFATDLKKDINFDKNLEIVLTMPSKIETNQRKIYLLTNERALMLSREELGSIKKVISDETQEWIIDIKNERTIAFWNLIGDLVKSKHEITYYLPIIQNKNEIKTIFQENGIQLNDDEIYVANLNYTNQLIFSYKIEQKNNENFLSIKSLNDWTNNQIFNFPFTKNLFIFKEKNIVFSSTTKLKKWASEIAKINQVYINKKDEELFNLFKKFLEKEIMDKKFFNKFYITHFLENGILFHKGKMDPLLRKIIESIYKESNFFNFIICTSTLKAGVNLKADNIFFTTLAIEGNRKVKLSIMNMIGRVGRIVSSEENQNKRLGKVFVFEENEPILIPKFLIKSEDEQQEAIIKELNTYNSGKIKELSKELSTSDMDTIRVNSPEKYIEISKMYKSYVVNGSEKYNFVKNYSQSIDPDNSFFNHAKTDNYTKSDLQIPNMNIPDIEKEIEKKSLELKAAFKTIENYDSITFIVGEIFRIYDIDNIYNKFSPRSGFPYFYNSRYIKSFIINFYKYIMRASYKDIVIPSNNPEFKKYNDEEFNAKIDQTYNNYENRISFLKIYAYHLLDKLNIDSNEKKRLQEFIEHQNSNDDLENLILEDGTFTTPSVIKNISELIKKERKIIETDKDFKKIMIDWTNEMNEDKKMYANIYELLTSKK